MSFEAREYKVFNECIDSAISTATEEFWKLALETRELETTERVGFMAHELRNALATARMAFTMLRTGQVGVSSRTADVLDRALGRLEQIVGQSLLDARLRAHIAAQQVSVSLEKLLGEVVEAIPSERGIAIAVEVEGGLELVADERLLVSAISNLLQNAAKFSHNGARVSLRARRDDDAVVIEVEDECGGLPEGTTDELFKPHVQAGTDRRGFGLGLAITREAAELIGGEISVRNLPGKGCVFAIRFRQPRAVDARQQATRRAQG
ncbi:MAG: HAMP domain-containing histidine kinase [Deltaproteobacteria bacterium]|nr:HAMP domain-containing histidine kinase [Deltaproteobacteria bacterium]